MALATVPAGRAEARPRCKVALAAAVAAWVALSCSSSSDPVLAATPADAASADAADASDAGPVCPLPVKYGSDVCEACLRATCCDVITACVADAACAALQTCAVDCLKQETDAGGCKTQCEITHAAGNAMWQKVFSCWLTDKPPTGCYVDCTFIP